MASTRDILRQTRTVRSIEQITRAMKTVAAIRLRRAEQRLEQARPFLRELVGLVAQVAAASQDHPFLQARPGGRSALVVITSDRGLCGGYNMSVVRQALAVGPPQEVEVVALGRKGMRQLARHGYLIQDRLVPLGADPNARELNAMAARVGERYLAGEVNRVMFVHAEFRGGASYRVRTRQVVPVPGDARGEAPDIIFEPAPPRLLPRLMARYLSAELLLAALESSASEHAARVAAMAAATDNAEDLIHDLTRLYNKARQAGITKELTEIVTAAEVTA